MYKKLLLIIFCLLLLSGCKSITEDDNYIEKIYNCLKNDSMTNTVALGYKYYLPKGVKKLKDYDYNQAFLVDNCYLYLYVDIISYYYEKELQKPNEEDTYYYETIEHDNKNGYILIKETEEEQYYLTIVYNYSKIEGYVSKNKINKMITLSSIILNSIEYNQSVIEKILEGDLGQFSEFTYEVNKPDGASSNFSQYLEEYVQKEDTEQLPDE